MEREKQFIDSLSKEELEILLDILNNRSCLKDIRAYIRTCLVPERVSDTYGADLLKDIPMSYLPISGIKTHRICSFFDFVYDYFVLDYEDKKEIKSLGDKTILLLDGSILFLKNYLEEEISILQKLNRNIISGKMILDYSMDYKTKFILKNKEEIINYLKQNGEEYIFSSMLKRDYFSDKNILDTVSILARYSHYNDLKEKNIVSFKKFIKTEKH